MSPGIPPGQSAGAMTPAEREARWALLVRFAIEAASEAEARAILSQALTKPGPRAAAAGRADDRPS